MQLDFSGYEFKIFKEFMKIFHSLRVINNKLLNIKLFILTHGAIKVAAILIITIFIITNLSVSARVIFILTRSILLPSYLHVAENVLKSTLHIVPRHRDCPAVHSSRSLAVTNTEQILTIRGVHLLLHRS